LLLVRVHAGNHLKIREEYYLARRIVLLFLNWVTHSDHAVGQYLCS
jgi:hypothetical protein